jgi:hypothetical protein
VAWDIDTGSGGWTVDTGSAPAPKPQAAPPASAWTTTPPAAPAKAWTVAPPQSGNDKSWMLSAPARAAQAPEPTPGPRSQLYGGQMGASAWDRLKGDVGEALNPKTRKIPAADPRAAPSQAAADRIGGDVYTLAVSPISEGIRRLGADPESAEFLGGVAPALIDPAMRGAGAVAKKVGPPSKGFAFPKSKGPPTPVGEGPVYGSEKAPVERLDNAMYRLRGHTTADKLEMKKFLKGLPGEAKDPVKQEALYHELESALANPKRTLSPEAQETLAHFQPYYKEQTDLINSIREAKTKAGLADDERYSYDQGYVARRAKGHSPIFDDQDAPDPILGSRSISQTTTAMHGRVPHTVLQAKDGTTHFIKGDRVLEDPGRYAIGSKQRIDGKTFTARPATTAEIESNVLGAEYHKNALVNTVDNVVRLRQTKRNIDTLGAALTDLKGRGQAVQESFHRPYMPPGSNSERPWMVETRTGKKAPEGFVELPHIPQLRGWKFEPRVAEVLKDYKPGPGEHLDTVLSKVNRALTGTLFWNPAPHMWNVANHWAVARGFDWMTPGGYKSLATNGARALQAVLTQNEDYRTMLREGSGLLYGDTETRNFYDLMLKKGVEEVSRDPATMSALMKSFDLKGIMPQKVVASIYKAANKTLWAANDVLMLQRQFELMDKGMPLREAIREAERDIPNYRIPSRVMGSRAVSQALRNPNMFLFGRYRYGLVKAWGNMFRDMYKGSPEERGEAAGKFLAAAILTGAAYPLADKAIQKVTGNDEAKLRRGGGFSPLSAGVELEKGQRGWASFISSLVSPAPAMDILQAARTDKDFAGRPILSGEATPGQNLVSGMEFGSGFVNPAQTAVQATQPGGAAKALARNLLVDYPPDDIERRRASAKKYERRAVKSRGKKDPLMRAFQ